MCLCGAQAHIHLDCSVLRNSGENDKLHLYECVIEGETNHSFVCEDFSAGISSYMNS